MYSSLGAMQQIRLTSGRSSSINTIFVPSWANACKVFTSTPLLDIRGDDKSLQYMIFSKYNCWKPLIWPSSSDSSLS